MKKSKQIYLPSRECVLCRRTLDETKGSMIVSRYFYSVVLSNKYRGGGAPDYPYVSLNIEDGLYAYVKGPKDIWTAEIKDYIVKEFKSNRHPWFCQQCCKMVCNVCGTPVQILYGCDSISESGEHFHSPIFPIPHGCINPDCQNYRE